MGSDCTPILNLLPLRMLIAYNNSCGLTCPLKFLSFQIFLTSSENRFVNNVWNSNTSEVYFFYSWKIKKSRKGGTLHKPYITTLT